MSGQVLATYNYRVVASVVEGETTVPMGLLLEEDEFVEVVRKADTIQEIVDWVNENY